MQNLKIFKINNLQILVYLIMNFFDNFDEKINNFIYPISDSITGLIFWEISFFQNNLPVIVVWLVIASIFFTFYFRFINISLSQRV